MPTDALSAKLSACDRLADTVGLPANLLQQVRDKVERGHHQHSHEPPPVAMDEIADELRDLVGYVAVEMAQHPSEPLPWKHRRCAEAAAELLAMLSGPDEEGAYLLEAAQRNAQRIILGWPWLPPELVMAGAWEPASRCPPPLRTDLPPGRENPWFVMPEPKPQMPTSIIAGPPPHPWLTDRAKRAGALSPDGPLTDTMETCADQGGNDSGR